MDIEHAKDRFTYGGCGILAYQTGKYLPENYYLSYTTTGGCHAWVVTPCKKYAMDIHGMCTHERMMELYSCHEMDEDNGDEMELFPNNEEGRAKFAEATEWFFECIEDIDEEVDYWASIQADKIKTHKEMRL